jgi:uncharacterized protein YprB with RNaseH-like and TPR domain
MSTPINRYNKEQLKWLSDHYCRHRHNYLDHYACWIAERGDWKDCPVIDKVGYLDIEATALNASFGYIYSYAILDHDTKKILGGRVTGREVRNYQFDKRLMKDLSRDIKKFTRVVTYYGTRFDMPFLRSRCLKHGLPFPEYQDLYHTDVFYMVRNKLLLYRNRLENACDFFDIPCKAHRLNPYIWNRASAGDEESLAYIWEHNQEDVLSLAELYARLERFSKPVKKSV